MLLAMSVAADPTERVTSLPPEPQERFTRAQGCKAPAGVANSTFERCPRRTSKPRIRALLHQCAGDRHVAQPQLLMNQLRLRLDGPALGNREGCPTSTDASTLRALPAACTLVSGLMV